jgi:hypothetical protein
MEIIFTGLMHFEFRTKLLWIAFAIISRKDWPEKKWIYIFEIIMGFSKSNNRQSIRMI